MKILIAFALLSFIVLSAFAKEVQGRQVPPATQQGNLGGNLRHLERMNAQLNDQLEYQNSIIESQRKRNLDLRNSLDFQEIENKTLREELNILQRRLDRNVRTSEGQRHFSNSRISIIGKALSEAYLKRSLTEDGYDLCELKLDDKNLSQTRPNYFLRMCKYDGFYKHYVHKCFSLEIDTDSIYDQYKINADGCF